MKRHPDRNDPEATLPNTVRREADDASTAVFASVAMANLQPADPCADTERIVRAGRAAIERVRDRLTPGSVQAIVLPARSEAELPSVFSPTGTLMGYLLPPPGHFDDADEDSDAFVWSETGKAFFFAATGFVLAAAIAIIACRYWLPLH